MALTGTNANGKLPPSSQESSEEEAKLKEARAAVEDSLNPTSSYLKTDPSFKKQNYDPYIRLITEDVPPEEALRRAPSFWQRLMHSLSR